MPTFDVKEHPNSKLTASVDEKRWITGKVTRKLTILASEPTDAVTVAALAPLPRAHDPHPQLITYSADNVDVSPVGNSSIYFEANISYSSPRREDDNEDPATQLPVEIEWSSADSEEEIDEDANGEPIENPGTAEPIVGITRNVSDLVGTFKKNFSSFDPASMLQFKNTTNSDTFYGFQPGTGLVKDIRAVLKKENNSIYWEVTVEIHFRPPYRTTNAKAWYKRVKCQGFYKVDTGGNVVRATDGDKQPVTSPVRLSDTGTQLAESDDTVWLEFQVYGESNFSSMGLI